MADLLFKPGFGTDEFFRGRRCSTMNAAMEDSMNNGYLIGLSDSAEGEA